MVKNGTTGRNLTADFLKGIMIFCVMYGHSITKINDLVGVTWKDSVVNVFMTSFEMPLFILISGYFLFFSLKKRPHFNVLWQRIVSIAIPILVWEGFPSICRIFALWIKNSNFSMMNLLKIGERLLFPSLWFLACYLICSIFVIFVDWLLCRIQDAKVKISLEIVVYAGIVIGLHFIKHSFNYVPFMFPFFVVGFMLSKYNLLNRLYFRKALWVLAGLFVFLYPFYKPENSFYIIGTYIADSTRVLLPIFIHRFVLGLSGCSLLYLIADYLCKWGETSKFVSCIIKLGNRTMELYILSVFVQNILKKIVRILIRDLSLINRITAPMIFGPIFLVVMTILCLLINHIISKNPKLHKVLFGR